MNVSTCPYRSPRVISCRGCRSSTILVWFSNRIGVGSSSRQLLYREGMACGPRYSVAGHRDLRYCRAGVACGNSARATSNGISLVIMERECVLQYLMWNGLVPAGRMKKLPNPRGHVSTLTAFSTALAIFPLFEQRSFWIRTRCARSGLCGNHPRPGSRGRAPSRACKQHYHS